MGKEIVVVGGGGVVGCGGGSVDGVGSIGDDGSGIGDDGGDRDITVESMEKFAVLGAVLLSRKVETFYCCWCC